MDGLLDNFFRTALHQADEGFLAQAAREAGIAAIKLLLSLHAGQTNLLGVEHDNVVTHIDVWGVLGIALARENARSLCCQTARVLPLASTTNHLRSISSALGIYVDISSFSSITGHVKMPQGHHRIAEKNMCSGATRKPGPKRPGSVGTVRMSWREGRHSRLLIGAMRLYAYNHRRGDRARVPD